MKKVIGVFILMVVGSSLLLAQNRSIYTSTASKSCRTIRQNDQEAGSYEGECRGVGGYKLRLIEGDLRQSINVITPAKKNIELNFWSFYSSFSSIGEKVEWRVKRGIPVALIARYIVSNPEDSAKTTSYLLVSKIGRTTSCVTDVVEPGPRQNERARQLADAATDKPCKPAL